MSSFELIGRRAVTTLGAEALLYRHTRLGSHHLHLASQDPEMGFLVGFPTLPRVADGRAHILEHIVLSGSERFPVRDPFFSMMRRSVATFMNAMTYPDRTVYPFATTDTADFFNLLDVYLDAAFFPKLERMSFLQEGWRPAIEDGRYAIHGVVFNEMKASYGDADRALYLGLTRELFAGTHYAEDSGGDPLRIPTLDYDSLKAFHAQHYHGSQAVFLSSGKVDPQAVQARIEAQVLARFSAPQTRLLPDVAGPLKGLPSSWRDVEIHVPVSPGAAESEHGLQLAWRFDEVASPLDKLRQQAVAELLAGHDGAPLKQAILGLGFGRPSGMSGPDTSTRQIAVHAGVSGLRADQLKAAESAILGALNHIAESGMPVEEIESVVRKLEFRLRQPRSAVYRLLDLVEAGLRGEDLLGAVDAEPVLSELAREMRAPDFLQRAVRQLLDCPQRLRAHVLPDEQYFAQRDVAERALIDARDAAMTEAERERIQADEAALAAHQAAESNDTGLLPRIRPVDLAREPQPLAALQLAGTAAGWQAHAALPTQGLSHAELAVDVTSLAQDAAPWLALLADVLPQLGAAGSGYAAAAGWRETRVQNFSVHLQARTAVSGELQVELVYTAAALQRAEAGMVEVLRAWYAEPGLHERERLATVLRHHVQLRVSHLQAAAESIAAATLRAGLSAQADWDDQIRGLPALAFLLRLDQALAAGDAGLDNILAGLRRALAGVLTAPRHVLWARSADDGGQCAAALAAALPAPMRPEAPTEAWNEEREPRAAGTAIALVADAQTQACGLAWSVPRQHEADAPALAVAAQLLTQQFLHTLVRERGGAYGVSASYAGPTGLFTIESHADPRLAGTYADFALALEQLQTAAISQESLEEAIVSVIKQLDKPVLPAPRLRQAWDARCRGWTEPMRNSFRQGVLDCSLTAVRAAAARHLVLAQARRVAAVAGSTTDLAGLVPEDLRAWGQRFGQVGPKAAAAPSL